MYCMYENSSIANTYVLYSLAIFSYPVPRSCERFSLLAKLIDYAITYFVCLCRYSLRPTKVQLHHNCTQLFRQIKQENEQLLREIINAIWNPNAHSSISSRKYREFGVNLELALGDDITNREPCNTL